MVETWIACFHADERVGELHSVMSDSSLTDEDDDSDGVLYGEAEAQIKINSWETLVISAEMQGRGEGTVLLRKYISRHPSPICFQKYCRENMIVWLPKLKVLDNLPIQETDTKLATTFFSSYYEKFPYRRMRGESILHIVQEREVGQSGLFEQNSGMIKKQVPRRAGRHFFCRPLNAATAGQSFWPIMEPVSPIGHFPSEEGYFCRCRSHTVLQVKQLLAVDGRLHLDLNIASSGSAHNCACSYYMNGGDYIISGGSDKQAVHICCAQTGRLLRDVVMEDEDD